MSNGKRRTVAVSPGFPLLAARVLPTTLACHVLSFASMTDLGAVVATSHAGRATAVAALRICRVLDLSPPAEAVGAVGSNPGEGETWGTRARWALAKGTALQTCRQLRVLVLPPMRSSLPEQAPSWPWLVQLIEDNAATLESFEAQQTHTDTDTSGPSGPCPPDYATTPDLLRALGHCRRLERLCLGAEGPALKWPFLSGIKKTWMALAGTCTQLADVTLLLRPQSDFPADVLAALLTSKCVVSLWLWRARVADKPLVRLCLRGLTSPGAQGVVTQVLASRSARRLRSLVLCDDGDDDTVDGADAHVVDKFLADLTVAINSNLGELEHVGLEVPQQPRKTLASGAVTAMTLQLPSVHTLQWAGVLDWIPERVVAPRLVRLSVVAHAPDKNHKLVALLRTLPHLQCLDIRGPLGSDAEAALWQQHQRQEGDASASDGNGTGSGPAAWLWWQRLTELQIDSYFPAATLDALPLLAQLRRVHIVLCCNPVPALTVAAVIQHLPSHVETVTIVSSGFKFGVAHHVDTRWRIADADHPAVLPSCRHLHLDGGLPPNSFDHVALPKLTSLAIERDPGGVGTIVARAPQLRVLRVPRRHFYHPLQPRWGAPVHVAHQFPHLRIDRLRGALVDHIAEADADW